MKRSILFSLLSVCFALTLSAQQTIEGRVEDAGGQPLFNVNVFLKETFEGASSDPAGCFRITTGETGAATLCARMLGYEPWEQAIPIGEGTDSLRVVIRLRPLEVALGNVEVVASTFQLKGSSQWGRMNAVDMVTMAGSDGDLYRSIATLPGTQAAAEDGRLFVRGGDSREVQTYIDDMHVMNPYTTTGSPYTPVRGRYSPFMFEGMNFSLGGYDPEYAQGLSSVLPLSTKDESPVSKYGVNLSTVGAGGGGTYAFADGSASLDLDYQNLGPYYTVVPDRTDWTRPYQKFSGKTQARYAPDRHTTAKVYAGYDYTSLANRSAGLTTSLKEHNQYINGTVRRETSRGYRLFAGAAFSWVDQRVQGGRITGDRFAMTEWEGHLKVKAAKRFSPLFHLQLGAESMFRHYGERYREMANGPSPDVPEARQGISHRIHALFATAGFHLTGSLSASLSSRLEYTTINRQWNYTPRAALNYDWNGFLLSAIAGRYTQLTYTDYLLRNGRLPSESCWHYIVGAYHQSAGRVYRAEAYYKNYDRLICEGTAAEAPGNADGNRGMSSSGALLTSGGQGYSKGIDLYFSDASLVKDFEYRLSYSLNDSKRKSRDMPVRDVPSYASRHNATLCLRYSVASLRSIVGLTERFASGRPYHDPNREGYMNATAPVYNSLDLSLTFLASKKVIVYASASNILGRKAIYGYTFNEAPDPAGRYTGTPIRANADQFFFIGIFITLGGNTAYDVSNF